MTQEEIQKWVNAAKEGDKEAFGALFDHFFEKIYRFISFRVDAADVEDIVEQTFLKAWIHLNKYRSEEGRFLSWLFRIAQNTVMDHYRRYRPLDELQLNVPDESPRSDPRPQAEQALLQDLLKECLGELKDSYQEVLTLKFLADLSNEEVASIMKTKPDNVRVLQFRALQALRKVIEKKGLPHDFL